MTESHISLTQAEQRFIAITRSPVEAIISVDLERNVSDWNRGAVRIFGYSPVEIAGRPVTDLVPEHLRRRYKDEVRVLLRTHGDDITHHVIEMEGLRKSGETFPARISLLPWNLQGQLVFDAIIRDISDQVNAEFALTRQSYRLRQLAARLQETREEERARLSREVHDRLGQSLTGLRMDIAMIERTATTLDPEVKKRLQTMKCSIDDTVGLVRKIASDLRPGILDDLGIQAAIEWEASEFGERSGIDVRFKPDMSSCTHRIDKSMSTTVFRVLQELLTNIVRHADAELINVALYCTDDDLVLVVEDDGVGFDTEVLEDDKSLGLLGIEERLAIYNGNFEVYSETGKGTRSVATLPLSIENQ